MNKAEGKLFIISGPSGAGKTTLVNGVLKSIENKDILSRVVTYTSRIPRVNDRHGIDYYFISREAFENKIKENFFFEWSHHYGNYYGAPHAALGELKKGKSLIFVIDPGSIAKIVEKFPQAIVIAIKVSSLDILLERLSIRSTETDKQIEARFLCAQKEGQEERKHSGQWFDVINDNFENALLQVKDIVFNFLES